MRHWSSDALDALQESDAVALVSILAVRGSAPRQSGTRMVVTREGCRGTIGGGNLEFQAIAQARRILTLPQGSWRVQDYPLGPLLGQCCGGHVQVQIERLASGDAGWLGQVAQRSASGTAFRLRHHFAEDGIARSLEAAGAEADAPRHARRPAPGDEIVEQIAGRGLDVLLVGAGHVGCAVARTLEMLPIGLDWVDTRPDYAMGGARQEEEAALFARIGSMAPNNALLVMTHDHGLDYRLAAAGLRSAAGFVGLIGSGTKRARFLSRLAKDGVGAGDRARLVCPVGLPGIGGKEPGVIAVAVAAQLLLLVENGITPADQGTNMVSCASGSISG